MNICILLNIGVIGLDTKIEDDIKKNLLSIKNANRINFFVGFYEKTIYKQLLTSHFEILHASEIFQARFLFYKKEEVQSEQNKSPVVKTDETCLVTWKV